MPKSRTIKALSITRAAAVSASAVDLACSPDRDDVGTKFTRLLRYRNGTWTAVDLAQHAESLCEFRDGSGRSFLYVMSREGDLADVDGGGARTKVEDLALRGKPHQLGFLYKVRQIGDALYAAGSGGQAYRREANGDWRVLDEALLDGPYPDRNWMLEYARNPELLNNADTKRQYMERLNSGKPKIFWTLAGISDNAIYFGGEQAAGILYVWDGDRSLACDLPTKKALNDIMIAPDGSVWICGRDGLLLKGRERRFEVVLDLGRQRRFSSLAWFEDRPYMGSNSGPIGLFVFDGRGAEPVRTGLPRGIGDAHTVEAVDGVLWAFGAKDLVRFDGRQWERIPVPGVSD
jgi:hypothetical protein